MSEAAGDSNDRRGRPERDPDAMQTVEVCNKRGLHARASAKFVQTAEQYDADIWVTRGNECVGGTSIMGLMMLSAGPGVTIKIEAWGTQAPDAVAALTALVAGRFAERD
jgi:phosphocarrier protein